MFSNTTQLYMLEIQVVQRISTSQRSDKQMQKLKTAGVYIQHSA